MTISVYEDGDIYYVEFGKHSQWFPFPLPQQALAPLSFVFIAYAAETYPPTEGKGAYSQKDKMEGNKLIRERYYSNGVKEIIVINKNRGKIENKRTIQMSTQHPDLSKGSQVKVLNLPPISPKR